ncbi:hypothetical protein KI387_018208, partial [Taxus chinensis]
VGRSAKRGIGREAKDEITGRGGMIFDKVIGFNGVDVRGNDTEVIFSSEEGVVGVEIDVSIGKDTDMGMDVTNVDLDMNVDVFGGVDDVSKGTGVMVDEE